MIFPNIRPANFWWDAGIFKGIGVPITRNGKQRAAPQRGFITRGRNKHHYEYWMDYGVNPEDGICGMKMPDRYIFEMFLDRIAASRTYKKESYTDRSPLEYYEKGNSAQFLHPHTP